MDLSTSVALHLSFRSFITRIGLYFSSSGETSLTDWLQAKISLLLSVAGQELNAIGDLNLVLFCFARIIDDKLRNRRY